MTSSWLLVSIWMINMWMEWLLVLLLDTLEYAHGICHHFCHAKCLWIVAWKKDIILEGSLNPEAMFKVVPSSISLHCKSQKEQHNGLHHTPVAVVVSRSRLEMHYCCLDHRMKAMPREPPSSDLHHTIYLKNKNPLKKIVDEWPLSLFPEKMLRDETPRALLIFFKTVALLL